MHRWVSTLQREQIAALEERLAARHFDAEDIQQVAAPLRKYAPQLFEVVTYDDDQEAVQFSAGLWLVMHAAGWQENFVHVKPALAGVIAGVVAYVSEDAPKRTKAAAWALVLGLKAKHIDASVREIEHAPKNLINVTVGIKP